MTITNDAVVLILLSLLPCSILCLVFYKFISQQKQVEILRERYLKTRDQSLQVLPIKLQAYERLTLFLERIQPYSLLQNTMPPSDIEVQDYAVLLSNHIKQEFEHNITQQIYVSSQTWKAVVVAKNTAMTQLLALASKKDIISIEAFQESLLSFSANKQTPSQLALEILTKEAKLEF